MEQSLLQRKTRLGSGLSLPWLLLLVLSGVIVVFVPMPGNTAVPTSRHIQVTAGDFGFSPGVLHVNPGDRVTIELSSSDVVHGLYLDGYDLTVKAGPGQPASLTFIADRSGTFRFRCSVTCGPLHPFMMGKLQVGHNGLFWRGVILAVLAVLFGLFFVGSREKAAAGGGCNELA